VLLFLGVFVLGLFFAVSVFVTVGSFPANLFLFCGVCLRGCRGGGRVGRLALFGGFPVRSCGSSAWGLLCLFPLCPLSFRPCPLLALSLLWLLRLFVLLLPVRVFLLRLLWLVVWFLPLPLCLLSRVLCLLSLPLTLVVWCVLLAVARSVACGLLLVAVVPLLLCPWLLLSVLPVALVLRWTCGVRLVVVVCLAPVTSALCLLAEGLSRLASLLRSSESVFARALPVAYRCFAVRPLRGCHGYECWR